ncbi:MAG: GAF domain-containing protein [Chloroflexi bacterium]|nr:GAF domain-containing protein [Chloroflexota bacterium]
MYQILALLEDQALLNQLQVWLNGSYTVIQPHRDRPVDVLFDVGIVDETTMARLQPEIQSRKQAEHPVALPFLLLTSRESIRNGSWQQWPLVDDFMTLPFDPAELQTRLGLLLKNRRASMTADAERQQTLAFLRRNEELMGYVAQNMPVMLNAWGENRSFVFWNQECERVTGYSAEEIVNNPCAMELLYPDRAYREAMMAEWEARNGEYRDWEWQLTTRDGTVKTIAWSSLASQFPILGWATWGVGVDVTERKAAQAAEHNARTLAEALRNTATTLTSTLKLDDVFDRILENVGRVVPHDAANVMLLDGDTAFVVRGRGYERLGMEQYARNWRVPLDQTFALRQIVKTRQPMIVPDMRHTLWKGVQDMESIRSIVSAPICWQDEVIGFITLNSTTPDFFTPVDADTLQAFAEQSAIAIQNARLYEKAHLLAAYEERQRLARDLHDAVSQSLFSASIITEALPRQMDSHPDLVKERLTTLHRLMRGALAETRTLLLELRPNDMAKMDIGPLLTQFVEGVQSRKNIWVETVIENQPQLGLNVKKALYRIAQEALNNVLKHAHATQASVSLKKQDRQIVLTIADNGRGFNSAQVAPSSMGLEIMRERAREIGAELSVHSQLGQGTEVTVIWTES